MSAHASHRVAPRGAAVRIITAVALCSLLVPAAAFAATPSTPVLTDVYVSAAGQITVTWSGSTDAGGHSLTYDVYRLPQPITGSNVGPLTPVASVTTTNATIAALSAEAEQSYVWFYAVRAKETNTPAVVSAVSKTMAANLHGYRLSSTAVTCTRCHSVHGAYPDDYDYTYVDLCYRCHGATSAGSGVGARSSLNVQAEFGDYDGQTQPGSVHRSTKMETDRTECDACHSAHRTPYYYDNNGVYVASSSYRKMIRVQTGVDAEGPTYTYYSQNADLETPAAAGENAAFCLACHGASATPIGYVGDAGDYALTGGDHNSAGYATAAHGPGVVKSNDYGRANESEYPQVQCLACHAKHASAADKLVAYRGSDAGGAYAEAGLCFACHSASSTESKVAAGYVKPFSWNDRDVQAEFGRASTHPSASSATGRSLTCANCHNVHTVAEGGAAAWSLSRVSTPSNTKNTPADMTAFCLDCHDGSPASATISDTALVPYRIGFSEFTAPDAPYFPGWDKSGFTGSGHYAPATGGQPALCKHCHDPHASSYARLTAWTAPTGAEKVGAWTPNAGTRANTSAALSQEESLCYQCHGDGTTGKRADGAKDVATKAAMANSHNPATWSGRHLDTEIGADLGSSGVHAECVDCHDPHTTRKNASGSAVHAANPAANASAPGAAVWGAWGVVPDHATRATSNPGTLNWSAPTVFSALRLTGAAADMEAYLCFKCHSQNIGTTMIPGLTDTAQEFNPSNFSIHNVTGQSVGMQSAFTVNSTAYTWNPPTASTFLKTGWTNDSKMTCTDCHTNAQNSATQAIGPHGSTVEWLIDPAWVNWTADSYLSTNTEGMVPANIICAKCHVGIDAANEVHVNHTGSTRGDCQYCHTSVPHGWKRPRLIAYTTDPLPYQAKAGGLLRVQRTNITNPTSSWDKTYCNGCGAGSHTYAGTEAW